MTKEQFLKEEAALDNDISSVWNNSFFDGVANYDKFSLAKYKILWILKEANKKDEKYHNFREFYNIVENEQTYYNIMRISYAIFNNIEKYDAKLLGISKKTLINGEIVLDQLAIINVNKSGGCSKSNAAFLNGEYKRDGVKDLLFRQINLINPQIIINCHGVDDFFLDQIENAPYEKDHGEKYAFVNNRLVINTRHPLMAHSESYCEQILKIFGIIPSRILSHRCIQKYTKFKNHLWYIYTRK